MSDRLQPHPTPRPLSWTPLVYTLQDILTTSTQEIYLVGGVVRDAFWGLPAHDIDLAVPGNAFTIARAIADRLGGAFYRLDPQRKTGRAIIEHQGGRITVDVAGFRDSSLLEDLRGRDFTINAVAAPLHGDLNTVIDPLGGLQDAQKRLLVRCTPHAIVDDPIRALRAVRLSVRFKLRIEPATLADIKRDGPRLIETSAERIRDEFMALLGGPRPAAALRTLDALGLLNLIVPEVAAMHITRQSLLPQQDIWQHTLATLEQLDGILQAISPARTEDTVAQAGLGMIVYFLDRFRDQLQAHIAHRWPDERPHRALLMLAALLHDSGKPSTRQHHSEGIHLADHEIVGAQLAEKRGAALRLSRQEIARLRAIVRCHTRPHLLDEEAEVSRRAVYRFWRDCGTAGVDVCLLALADYLATAGPALSTERWSHFLLTTAALLDGALGQGEANVTTLPTLVTGNDLINALRLSPGPQIGELLAYIREAQAAGEIHTAEEALALARDRLRKP